MNECGGEQVVEGSGSRGKPRRLAQMISVRLEPELVVRLREIAERDNTTVSELLRVGATLVASRKSKTNTFVSGSHTTVDYTVSSRETG